MGTEQRAEEMGRFFDVRAEGYDAHMRGVLRSFEAFYAGLAAPLAVLPTPFDTTTERIGLSRSERG